MEYLATLHDRSPKLYYAAMEIEIAELSAALRGYAIKSSFIAAGELIYIPEHTRRQRLAIRIGNHINLSDDLKKDAKYLIVVYKHNGLYQYETIPPDTENIVKLLAGYGTEGYEAMMEDRIEKLKIGAVTTAVFDPKEQIDIVEDMLGGSALIAVTSDWFTMKCKMEYEIEHGSFASANRVEILEVLTDYLTQEDKAFLEGLEKEGKKEEDKEKAKNEKGAQL